MLTADASWVIRRKEGLELLDEHSLRRSETVDVDMAVVGEVLKREPDCTTVVPIPLFFLRKLPDHFFNFDLIDDAGRSLPLSSRAMNGDLSALILQLAAKRALGTAGTASTRSGLSEPLDAALIRLASEPQGKPDESELLENFLEQIRDSGTSDAARLVVMLSEDRTFPWLFRLFAKASVVTLRVFPTECSHRFFKLRYDERVSDRDDPVRTKSELGWEGYPLAVEIPFMGSRNFHFQIEAPTGTRLVTAYLDEVEAPREKVPAHFGSARRAHLYMPDTAKSHSGVAYVLFKVTGNGFVGAALLAAILVAATLTVFVVVADRLVDGVSPHPAYLLAIAGAVASFAALPVRHALTVRLLKSVRHLAIGSAAIAYAGALLATYAPGRVDLNPTRGILAVLAAAAWIVAGALLLSWRLPAPRDPHRRIAEEGLDADRVFEWLADWITEVKFEPPPPLKKKPASR